MPTNRVLLDEPKYSAALHGKEIAAVRSMWERRLLQRLPDSQLRVTLSLHVVPFAIEASARQR
jgi:predicted deacylase